MDAFSRLVATGLATRGSLRDEEGTEALLFCSTLVLISFTVRRKAPLQAPIFLPIDPAAVCTVDALRSRERQLKERGENVPYP